ncbi:MAG: histidine triad nucleotide-binding protein [Acidimicrobiia bacterium]|nr:histidine triad nucleotide-binding protein [Acidimicrobiia bacterium]
MSSDCLFCSIAAGDLAADIVESSEHAVAFRDINPVAPTHILVIPKAHIGSIAEPMPETVLSDMVSLAASVAASEGLADGWRLVSNVGQAAGQSVPHLHFHVLGGRQLSWPPG